MKIVFYILFLCLAICIGCDRTDHRRIILSNNFSGVGIIQLDSSIGPSKKYIVENRLIRIPLTENANEFEFYVGEKRIDDSFILIKSNVGFIPEDAERINGMASSDQMKYVMFFYVAKDTTEIREFQFDYSKKRSEINKSLHYLLDSLRSTGCIK